MPRDTAPGTDSLLRCTSSHDLRDRHVVPLCAMNDAASISSASQRPFAALAAGTDPSVGMTRVEHLTARFNARVVRVCPLFMVQRMLIRRHC